MPNKKLKLLHEEKNISPQLKKKHAKAQSKGERPTDGEPQSLEVSGVIEFRPYQAAIFQDRTNGVVVLHWARQIGKSFTLAAWAVDRLITRPGRLVTVLSNSRENGAEFLKKCVEICRLNNTSFEEVEVSKELEFEAMRMELRIVAHSQVGRIKVLAANPRTARGFSGDLILDEFAFHEDSAAIWEAAEPILASNPDFLCRIASTGNGKHNMFYRLAVPCGPAFAKATAGEVGSAEEVVAGRLREVFGMGGEGMGESGKGGEGGDSVRTDAHGEFVARPLTPALSPDGGEGEGGMEEAGESDGSGTLEKDKLLRVADLRSDPFAQGGQECPRAGGRFVRRLPRGGVGLGFSESGFVLSRMTRTQAYFMGVKIYDARTRAEVKPEVARAAALDKRAYDQNYECVFEDENLTLLSHELITAAEREGVGEIAERDWSPSQLELLRGAAGPLFLGFDVARKTDLSVITVLEKLGEVFLVRAILRIQDMRLPDQQLRLGEICRLAKFQRGAIDMTGLGLGLFEYAQKEFGRGRIHGINFGTSVPVTRVIAEEGRKGETVRVTEAMALELLRVYEDRRIQQPADGRLRDDLRKPERVTSPGGRVSIAATRDEAGHADHFWSLALAVEAAGTAGAPFAMETFRLRRRGFEHRTGLM